MHNIFKIDQKLLSKQFITSQEIFVCSKSTRESDEIDIVFMSLFFILGINKNRYGYINISIANLGRRLCECVDTNLNSWL